MNNNDNINNQSGNNSTTFNAYNEQKNAAQAKGNSIKNKAMSKGEDLLMKKGASVLAKTGPWGAAAAALLKAAQAQKKASEAEGNGKGTALGNNVGGAIANKALGGKSPLDLVKGAKGIADIGKFKTLKIKLIILGVCASIFAMIFGVVLVGELKNQVFEDVATASEKFANLFNFGSFNSDQTVCYQQIDKADANLDKGILLATVDNGALISPELIVDTDTTFDESLDTSSEELGDWQDEATLLDSDTAQRFYAIKKAMVTDKNYSMIDALSTKKVYIVRVKDDNSAESDYTIYKNAGYKPIEDMVDDLAKDILLNSVMRSARKSGIVMAPLIYTNPFFNAMWFNSVFQQFNAFKSTDGGNGIVKYKARAKALSIVQSNSEISSFFNSFGLKQDNEAVADATENFFEKNVSFVSGFDEEDEAGAKYVLLAKTEVANDYEKFYNYIAYVYVPTIYRKFWESPDVTDEEKKELVREVWDDIVMTRNGYDEYNTLDASFDEFGNLSISYSGTVYIGNLPTTEAAKKATSWKQMDDDWKNYRIGNGSKDTMGRIGCLVTSIAKIAAISGTQIDSDTFDPGVLASHMSFTSGGDLIWNAPSGKIAPKLLPNFRRVNIGSGYVNISSNVPNVSNELANYINKSGYTGSKYYYTFHIQYSGGTHFIAIVGSDENGFIVSDPTYGEDTYYLNNISNVINRTVVIKGFQVYEKMD